jgi:hypothetical protein
LDVAQRLPRFYRHQQQIEALKRIGKIVLEGGKVENERGLPLRRPADGHREDRRRRLPMISKGVGGTSPGTDPVRALLAKERRNGGNR